MQPDPSLAGATSPVPQVARIPREQLPLSRPYLAPRTGVERRLVEIWQDALQVAPVGVDDDYYELGGNSLRGLEIFLQIEQEYGERLPLSILVEQPTVRSLAEALGRSGAPDRRCLVPLQASGAKPPLFCVHDISGNVVVLRQQAQPLGPEQPFYGQQYPGQTVRPHAPQ